MANKETAGIITYFVTIQDPNIWVYPLIRFTDE